MKYLIITFGCQMNKSDSERIAAVLERLKYKKASTFEEADLIVVNMCSVRQSAVDRIFGISQKIAKLKKKKKKIKSLLTGCILKKDRKKLSEKFDFILDIKNLPNLAKILKEKKPIILPDKLDEVECAYLKIKPRYQSSFSAFVPIMTGCNNFCTYCVVPYTRGREVSRPAKEILKEVRDLIKKGYKEIWLLGQNVNSYKSSKKINFSQLLKMVNNISGNFWIRFTSPHPKDFSDELIRVMASSKKITPYLNLPVQSGDNEILKKMNRSYTVEEYKNLVKKIRKKIPDIALSTDIIVGFPGETRKQFENTVKLFKEIKFDMAYIAKYSLRAGTAAAKLKDSVSPKEKERRYKVLTKILKETALENNKKFIGKKVKVLVESCKDNFCLGKSAHYKTVKFHAPHLTPEKLVGQFIRVKIIDALPWGLKGEMINSENTKKLIVILGPTASGKTDLSIKLAKKFDGEIVSADSRQVYKGMDIGTGKITKKEMKGIPHYLLDVASPKRRFTVAQYQKLALMAIEKILKKKKVPFLVGGTAFYIQSVVDGIVIPKVKPDWNLRKKLERKTTEKLFEILKKLDPKRAKNIDKNNRQRLIRAIEIAKSLGSVPPLSFEKPNFKTLIIGIKKNQKELNKLIEKRLLKRFKKGMIKEVKKLHDSGISWKRLEEFGLEYRWIARYLQNKITYQEMVEKLKKDIEHFAKRQMTWFRKDKRIKWIKNYQEAERLIKNFLSKIN